MSVGKGSLKRAVAAKPIVAPKNETVFGDVVEVEIDSLKFKKEKNNAVMLASVKAFGVLLPIIAVKDGDGLKVIDGSKRLSALSELGINKVKAVIVDADGKAIASELKKFKPKSEAKAETHECKAEKLNAIGDELPIYLL